RGAKDGSRVPQLSDLRESGAIEQDADMVMFLYRPEYYDVTTNADGENTKGLTEVKIAKHRNGSLETVKLKALLHIQKFVNWDEDPYSGIGLPAGGWRPVDDSGGAGGEKLYIQTGSKMNNRQEDEEDPF
ncbi:MAG: DnaB-like helicase C-terminal domain-containing protein, partial [Chitinophagaceae bacterium]